MRKGVHTIRSGITNVKNPTEPRRYSLDNGDFELNMKVRSVEIFPIGNDPTGGGQNDFPQSTIFFVLATSRAGAIPTASTVSDTEFGDVYNLRPSDSSQIGWGTMFGAESLIHFVLDPDNILPEDLYVNAWSISTAGSINPVASNIGFIIKMEQVKNTGSESLLYQIKESAVED
tara:strand:+ start:1097 stop:1618 length:522 start_codon:yes stop_codon:yes gene_type:complete